MTSTHGKRYAAARAQVDRDQVYSPLEAIRLLKGAEGAKFDETVEAHFRLGLNVRHADQQLRGTLMLPHGTGRTVLHPLEVLCRAELSTREAAERPPRQKRCA